MMYLTTRILFTITCLCLCIACGNSSVTAQIWLGWGPGFLGGNAPQQTNPLKPFEPTYPGQLVVWAKPPSSPGWIEQARRDAEVLEHHRQSLAQIVDFELNGKSLRMVFLFLTEQTGVPFIINIQELDLLGVDPDEPITIKAKTTLDDFITLMLEPLELTHRVRPAGIEITSRDAADADPSVECYDVRLVIPTSDLVKPLVETITVSIDPDSWLSASGTSSCMVVGHVLVIAAPESTQDKVKSLLANIARFREEIDAAAAQASSSSSDEG